MRRALITGVSGFVGSHLASHLLDLGWKLFGFNKQQTNGSMKVFVGDITDRDALKNVMKECRPDVIFHLAAVIKSSDSELFYNVNLLGTVALFDTLVDLGMRPLVVVASSSAVYGSGHGSRPISEKYMSRPVTHYAISKLAQEHAALRYFTAYQMPVMVVRMFNLLGPGQSPDLACSAFARQIALAEAGGDEEILTGNLNSYRDFLDVRDAVRAFGLLVEKGGIGETYNVCSGSAFMVGQCLDEIMSISPRQFKVRVDPGHLQKNDVPIQVGNGRKLNQATGWKPQISLKQSLSDLLDYWRQKIEMERS
jgi:GDP-4-dehydro-6-deoxy-D-mannose reductase